MNDQPKFAKYAAIIEPHIKKLFTDEADVKIDIEEIEDEENFQEFLHALSTVVPCSIYNRLVGEKKNLLEYNHIANTLCCKFIKIKRPYDEK